MLINTRLTHNTKIVQYELIFKANKKSPKNIKKSINKNLMEIPILDKIILNLGFPNINKDKKSILLGSLILELLALQRAVITKSKKAHPIFKIREKMAVGVKTTLRGKQLMFFFNRLICFWIGQNKNYTIPQLTNSSFTNYSLQNASHFTQQVNLNTFTFKLDNIFVFPEIEEQYDLFVKIKTLDVTFNFKINNSKHRIPECGLYLALNALQFPLKK